MRLFTRRASSTTKSGPGRSAAAYFVSVAQLPAGNDDHNDNDNDEALACDADLLTMMSSDQASKFDSMALSDQVAALAVQRARFGKRTAGSVARPLLKARAKAKAGARPQTPPRTDARTIKCGNCVGERATRDCSKPMLARDKRLRRGRSHRSGLQEAQEGFSVG